MPTLICGKCVARLTIAYDFVQMSHASEKNLKAFLTKISDDFQMVTKTNTNISNENVHSSNDEDDLLLEFSEESQILSQHENQHQTQTSIKILKDKPNSSKACKTITQNATKKCKLVKDEKTTSLKQEQPIGLEDETERKAPGTATEAVETEDGSSYVVCGNDNFGISDDNVEEDTMKSTYNENIIVKELDIYEISRDCEEEIVSHVMEVLDESSEAAQDAENQSEHKIDDDNDDDEIEEGAGSETLMAGEAEAVLIDVRNEENDDEEEEQHGSDGYLKEYENMLEDDDTGGNSQSCYTIHGSSIEALQLYENSESCMPTADINMATAVPRNFEELSSKYNKADNNKIKSTCVESTPTTTSSSGIITRKPVKYKSPRSSYSKRIAPVTDEQSVPATTTFYCIKCNRDFSTKTNLTRHLVTHEGKKPYSCNICAKSFTQNGSLKQHLYTHSGERPYVCALCNRGFTQCKSLIFHMRRHTGEKPFRCEKCGSFFRQKDGLKAHILKHHMISEQDGDCETYTCVICQKVLTSKSGFQAHMKKHLNNQKSAKVESPTSSSNNINAVIVSSTSSVHTSDDFMYDLIDVLSPAAEEPPPSTWEMDVLNTSSGTSASEPSRAKKFQCRKCFKCFAIKKNLIRHLSVHNGSSSELFQCNICTFNFDSNYALKLHRVEQHNDTNVSLTECDDCNIIFQNVEELNDHMSIAHGINCPIYINLPFKSQKQLMGHMSEHQLNDIVEMGDA